MNERQNKKDVCPKPKFPITAQSPRPNVAVATTPAGPLVTTIINELQHVTEQSHSTCYLMDPNAQTCSLSPDYNDSSCPEDSTPRLPQSHAFAESVTHTLVSYVSCANKEETARTPGGECSPTTRDVEPLELCHVVSPSIASDMPQKFECAWGMRPGEFKFNVASNSLLLTREMRARFENYDWALVPTKEVLRKIIRFIRKGSPKATHYLKEFPDQMWDYHFVRFRQPPIDAPRPTDDQLAELAQCTIEEGLSVRAGKEGSRSGSDHLIADVPAFQVDKYPVEELGLVRSHVHPFFAAYNAAEKLYRIKISKDPRFQASHRVSKYNPELWECLALHACWRSVTPASLHIHATQQLPNPSYPRSTSRIQSDECYEHQQSDRDVRAPKRQRRSGPQDSPSYGSGTTDSYLSTSEQSVDPAFADREHLLGTWVDVDGWAEGVKSAAPADDPYTGGTEQAEQSLAEYKSEKAWFAPSGS
ncbi:unnamed protein product [Rhizoctonia solani]|uniref:HNH nuclease domain-containing protein n=1 Tax=Rhizoctonia solani TaxID=456999 RepID=A0A8H3I3Y4_9AGAM|nr:unnamed protein product [Rhizoctonia solani]